MGSMMIAARLFAPICFSVHLGRERAVAVLVGDVLRREAHRQVGAAVVGVVERDDGHLLREVARDLHGVLDGLGARVEERRALLVVAGGELVELLGDGDVVVVGGDGEARVREGVELGGDGLDDARVGVADAGHGDARAEVDDRVAVGVDDDAAPGRDDRDGDGGADALRDGDGLAGHELLRARAGDAGDEAALLREGGAADGGGRGIDEGHGMLRCGDDGGGVGPW
jgi:hypothetical protein